MSALSIANGPAEFPEHGTQKMKIGKRYVSVDLKPALERFLLSSNQTSDRRKAFEMLSYINDCDEKSLHSNSLIKEYKLKKCLQRPKTAHAKLHGNASLQRFSTTYNEYYPTREIKDTLATRPPSTENIIVRANNSEENEADAKDNIDISTNIATEEAPKILSVYDKKTTYTKDYCSPDSAEHMRLAQSKVMPPGRAATSSGSRCHNPHPSQAFLVWRYPRESQNKGSRVPSESLLKADMDNKFAHITDEQFDRVMRGNCRSTYQADFVGGYYPESRVTPFYIQPAIKTGEKLKISTQRIDYNEPRSLPVELSVPHDRYKSNKTKYQSARGIIPEAINKVYLNTNVRTTYDEDINDRAEIIHGQIVADIQRKVDFSRLHNMKDLEKAMIDTRDVKDKETLSRIFQNLSEPDDYKRKSFIKKPFYNNDRPCWTSNWPGPL